MGINERDNNLGCHLGHRLEDVTTFSLIICLMEICMQISSFDWISTSLLQLLKSFKY